MDLSNYSVKDFVLNESFQKWILTADDDAHVFWEEWLFAHPEKDDMVMEARAIIHIMRIGFEEDTLDDQDAVWNRITKTIWTHESDAVARKPREIENTQ
jgi:hypothetical protein